VQWHAALLHMDDRCWGMRCKIGLAEVLQTAMGSKLVYKSQHCFLQYSNSTVGCMLQFELSLTESCQQPAGVISR
jgi:hypothetical protein